MTVEVSYTSQTPGRPLMGPYTQIGPDLSWIVVTLERRRAERGVVLEQMRRIRDAYNGDIVVPLPEMSTNEDPSVANLIVTGIDQTAQRIASVMPNVDFPPLRPGIAVSMEMARTRTKACRSWWDGNRMSLKMRRRARYLVGYASAPAVIRPNYAKGIPTWEIRDPLSAYPCPTQDPDDITPPDCIFTYFKSWGWLKNAYPMQAMRLAATYTDVNRIPGHLQFELVEYVDAEVTVLGVLGQKQWGRQWMESTGINAGVFCELERIATPGGMCPAVVPGRITLERPRGQFDASVGMYEMQARLMALELIAVERGIFPDTYLISRANETAQFVTGPHDGRTGLVNVVKGGDIREQNINPGFATTNILNTLERNERITSGIPPEYGGESQTNVRTGKRGDSIMAAVTSFPVQEAQEVLAAALEEENRRAVAIMKECFGRKKTSFYMREAGTAKAVTYVPNETFETDVNRVTYSMAGADQNGLVVGGGQRVGLGTMSKRTFMDVDPMIDDPVMEEERVIGEALQAAVLSSLQSQAQQGAIPPGDIARISELVTTNKATLYEAIDIAHKEAQARQANDGAPGDPNGPVAPGSPQAQPGLAQPGVGAEQPSVGAPPQGLQNVGDFLKLLHQRGGVPQ